MAEALDILLPIAVFLVCAWMQYRKREHRKARMETNRIAAEFEALVALTGGVLINGEVFVVTPEVRQGFCHSCEALSVEKLCAELQKHRRCGGNIWKRIEAPPSLKR